MSRDDQSLHLDGLIKRYEQQVAVNDVSLSVEKGRFLTLLGPSGSGKTTLLMMIAGFVSPTSGALRLGGRDITRLPPEKRAFGMVFQGYALFPHLSVADNVAFPLKLRRTPRAEIARRVERMLDIVRLTGLGERMPRQLSGGQQQRVALARALVFDPAILLLDEPLSALDKKLREGLQQELRELHQRLGTTFIFVTHDQDEALSMSDEIVIINHGRIIQQGSPRSLYQRPVSHFVADFLGRSNFIAGRAVDLAAGQVTIDADGLRLRQDRADQRPIAAGEAVLLSLRPEKVMVSSSEPERSNRVAGRVVSAAYQGADHHVRLETRLGPLQATIPAWRAGVEPVLGAELWASWDSDAGTIVTDDRS